uniref:MAM domain-containing protein n=1 Tax=Elaeophora elaphi TaxID=1147741 RepID=A0A0R3S6R9_9BILA
MDYSSIPSILTENVVDVETMRWMVALLFVVLEFHPDFIHGCTPRYQEELQYLDYYLGIQPENQGNLEVEETTLKQYISNSMKLNCQFDERCAWMNAPADDLLDTSDFYLFVKTNTKLFPPQIQPGSPNPSKGTKFVLAGNTTRKPQSAVLISAPIACQRAAGSLKFKYWLYNEAKIEVLILKPSNRWNRLRVILRPNTDCYFIHAFNDRCKVDIPEIPEPFRIGIRVHGLKDSALGSLGMITDIEYEAEICLEPKLSTMFGARAVPSSIATTYPISAVELSCADYNSTCRWSNSLSSSAEWKIGWNHRRWRKIFETESKPTGSFFYQYVDSVTQRPYSLLRSDLIPCTKTVTTFTFRYWLQTGTQVQVCTVSSSNVIISCVYLNEVTMPGPISIDVDSPTEESFRFVFELINFDNSTFGLVAIDDIQFTGLLCHEVTVPPSTTINPLQVKQLFSLKPYQNLLIDSIPTLNCDFNQNTCPQWENDGHWSLGTLFLIIPWQHYNPEKCRVLQMQKFSLHIFEPKKLMQWNNSSAYLFSGWLSMRVNRKKPFFIRLIAKSTEPGVVIIRKIETVGNWCPLSTLSQYACEKLSCTFRETFCDYKTETNSRANILFSDDAKGATADINKGSGLAVLRSPQFKLARPAELQIKVYQSTFGSQTFLCGNDFSTLYDCQPILGPKIELPTTEKVILPLDQDAQNFTIVALHDKFAQFGAAKFIISNIEMLDENGKLIC